MKKALYFLFLLLLGYQTGFSQQKPQYGTWNTVALRGGFRQITVQVSYKLSICDPKTGLVGESYFRTNNLKAWPGVYVSFDFDFQRCDGSIGTQHVTVEVANPGVAQDEGEAWFLGCKIIHPYYNVVIKDPVFDKALALKDQVDELGVQLADKYNKVSLDLLKIKKATTRQEYLAAITKIRGKIETAERDAQSDYLLRDGDKMAEQMDIMKQWGDQYDENDGLIQGILAKQESAVNTTTPLNLSHDVNEPKQQSAQQQQQSTSGYAGQPGSNGSATSKTATAPASSPRVTSVSTNPNVQKAIAEINNAQNATDAIARTGELNQADLLLLYEQTHGNNTPQVQQLRQQIAQLQKQPNVQNTGAPKKTANNASGGSADNFSAGLQSAINDITSKNNQAETDKAQNSNEVKKSMNDFFNNVSFDKKDTAKTDTLKKKPIKQ